MKGLLGQSAAGAAAVGWAVAAAALAEALLLLLWRRQVIHTNVSYVMEFLA